MELVKLRTRNWVVAVRSSYHPQAGATTEDIANWERLRSRWSFESQSSSGMGGGRTEGL